MSDAWRSVHLFRTMVTQGHIFFHSPCFDGVASAVLAWDFLELRWGWSDCELRPVNYGVRDTWLSTPLPSNSAVVDFLFHPDAAFFADHHASSFLDRGMRNLVLRGDPERWLFDAAADSCAGLLWRHVGPVLADVGVDHSALVQWANKIDAARYASVHEALFSDAPAIQVSWALSTSGDRALPSTLVRELRRAPLESVADSPAVVTAFRTAQASVENGLERLKRSARIDDHGVVVFDVDARGTVVSRYAPYYLFPEARYSAGIVRSEEDAKIVVMRNPWLDFDSVPLGEICARFGGGGHQRVGAVALKGERVGEARAILGYIVSEIENTETRADAC